MEPAEPEGIRHGLGKATSTSNIPAINTLPASGSGLGHAGINRTNMERLLDLPPCHWPHSRETEPPAHGGGAATVHFPWTRWEHQHSTDPKLMGELNGRTCPKNITPLLLQRGGRSVKELRIWMRLIFLFCCTQEQKYKWDDSWLHQHFPCTLNHDSPPISITIGAVL